MFPPAGIGQGDRISPSRLRHEESIRQVLARFELAFAKQDAAICTSSFVDDAEWENDYGSREKGRAIIEKRLSEIYSVVRQPKQLIVELRIRFITDDVAVADVDREILEHPDPEDDVRHPVRKIRTTHIFRREKGSWRVVIVRIAELRTLAELP